MVVIDNRLIDTETFQGVDNAVCEYLKRVLSGEAVCSSDCKKLIMEAALHFRWERASCGPLMSENEWQKEFGE